MSTMPPAAVPMSGTFALVRKRGRWAAACLPGIGAAALWRVSLLHVSTRALGEYGLPPALPVTWYLALAVALLGALAALCADRGHPAVAIAYVCLTALILFGTVAALSGQPHYAWTYKHIGVVRYLQAHGTANPSVDIYNRWPGFFALAAVFSALAGSGNPAAYAAWADLFFLVLAAVMATAAVITVTRAWRVGVGAALLLVLSNWVGQTYFSPQAFAYVLGLALITLILAQLRTAATPRWLVRLIERVGRTAQLTPDPTSASRWPRAAAPAAAIALDAVIVASHQLTPYMLLGGVALLALFCGVRPWWLLAAMAAMTLGYLAANLHFITHNYGLFTSIDPFNNVQGPRITQHPGPGKVFNTDAELVFIALVALLTLTATVRLMRRGLLVQALPFLALAVSPVAIVFGQNYGGEASLRIVLFSSPWCAALIAWSIATLRSRAARRFTLALVVAVFAPLFVISYLGQEELNIVSAAEVQASEWFYTHARRGSVLVLAAPGFPYRYGAAYPQFRGPEGDANPNLMTEPAFQGRSLGAPQLPAVAARIRLYSAHGYIAFSRDETEYAEVFRITPPGAIEDLRRAVAASAEFRLSFANRDAQIYELLAPAALPAPRRPRAVALPTGRGEEAR
ncbi:MAG TPA: hypothetical protein VGN13_06890 [Solirubrobacteraceae bacterium]|jgi:hypothetical protein